MGAYEVPVGVLLIVVLIGVAGFYGWRQIAMLRQLPFADEPDSTETAYRRAQGRRRLLNCVLMLLLAAMLTGAFAYMHAPLQRLADAHDQAEAAGVPRTLTAEDKSIVRLSLAYVVVFLLVLLAVLVLAFLDLWATRRFGMGEHRKIQSERREMIARQVARMRQDRNGHGS